MFKIKISHKDDPTLFVVGVGLQFQKTGEDIIRTLIIVSSRLGGKYDEEFKDDINSYWSRGYLIKQFKNGKFIYLGFKK